MVVLLLQSAQELHAVQEGLRIPDRVEGRANPPRAPIAGGSGLSNLFANGLHFDAAGTCYVWHGNSNCYAVPFALWSHPDSPVRERVMAHWPHGEQLSFWPQLFEPIGAQAGITADVDGDA